MRITASKLAVDKIVSTGVRVNAGSGQFYCGYTFDSDIDRAIDLGFDDVPDVSGQKISYTVQGGLEEETNRIVTSASNILVDLTGDITAWEVIYTCNDNVYEGSDDVTMSAYVMCPITCFKSIATLVNKNSAGSFFAVLKTQNMELNYFGPLLSNRNVVGYEFNPTTERYKIYLNGVDLVLDDNDPLTIIDDQFIPGKYVLAANSSEGSNGSSSSAGDVISVEFVTNAANMVGTYSAGAKDICGNLI